MKWIWLILLVCGLHCARAQDVTGTYKHNLFGYHALTLKADSTYVYSSFPRHGPVGHDFGTWYKVDDTIKTSTANGTIRRAFLYISPMNVIAKRKGLLAGCIYGMDTAYLGLHLGQKVTFEEYLKESLYYKLNAPAIGQQDTSLQINSGHVIYYGDTVNRFNANGERHGTWVRYDYSMTISQEVWYACGRDSSTSGRTLPDTSYTYSITGIGICNNGKEDGEWAYFYHNGKPKSVINYSHGKVIDKTIQLYYNSGKLKLYAKIYNENRVGYTEYSEAGKVLKKYKGSLILLLADL